MSQYEQDLIKKLSAQSAEPKAEFARALHEKLVNRERILKSNLTPKRRLIMNFRKLTLGLASVALLAGAAVLVLAVKFNKDDEPKQTAQTSSTSSDLALTSSLPTQLLENIEEAKKLLTFTPLLPSHQLNNETLSAISVGAKNNMLDDSDTLYLTYSDALSALYKISESTKSFNYPTDAEQVTFQINGANVTANFYKLHSDQSEGINSTDGGGSAPTSYMFWNSNGVNYEISEFGRVTKSELIKIASSFK